MSHSEPTSKYSTKPNGDIITRLEEGGLAKAEIGAGMAEILVPSLASEVKRGRDALQEIRELVHLAAKRSSLGYAGGILAKDISDLCDNALRSDEGTN